MLNRAHLGNYTIADVAALLENEPTSIDFIAEYIIGRNRYDNDERKKGG